MRAAACWIWLLLSALLKGSLSSRVFLCTISRGFLNMASSSLTPAPQVKTRPYCHKHTSSVTWLVPQATTTASLLTLWIIHQGVLRLVLPGLQSCFHTFKCRHLRCWQSKVLLVPLKKTHTRHSVYLTITGLFGLASKWPDKLYTCILKNHQASWWLCLSFADTYLFEFSLSLV